MHDCTEFDISQRLLCKITENNGEKLDRCSELCAKYAKILLLSEKRIESTAEALKVKEFEILCNNTILDILYLFE